MKTNFLIYGKLELVVNGNCTCTYVDGAVLVMAPSPGGSLWNAVGEKDRWERLEESRLRFKKQIGDMNRIVEETRKAGLRKVTKTKTIEVRRRMKETKRRKEEKRKRYKARRVPIALSRGRIRDRWEKLEESRIRFKNRWKKSIEYGEKASVDTDSKYEGK